MSATRASSLPADERRAAIAATTLPLLLEAGTTITTRQIADAAGIAEGTIFRVFPDKDAVIRAAVDLAFDPTPTREAIAAIDLDRPLRERLTAAVALIQERTEQIVRLMGVMAACSPGWQPTKPSGPVNVDGLVALFQPDRKLLRCEPHIAAQVLRSLTFGGTHPLFTTDDGPLTPDRIVDLVLSGVAA